MLNAATVICSISMRVDHACILEKKSKPPVARKLAVRHTKRKLAVRYTSFVCLAASFLATGGFVKLFYEIS